MEEPRSELKADPRDRQGAPDFDELAPIADVVAGERTRDDFFDAALDLDSPSTASEFAEIAGHGVDAAREYLAWFERIGIVTRVSEAPAMYERNQEYLDWRRVQRLRTEYEAETLLNYLADERERDESYAETFDTDSPDEVAIAAHASETGQSVEAVWTDVSAWKTTRRRIALLERALQSESSGTTGRRSVA
mgnify:FL=1